VRRLGQAKWSASLGTNVLDSLYRRLEYLSEFLKSKPFDHHHRSVIKAALLHSFSSAKRDKRFWVNIFGKLGTNVLDSLYRRLEYLSEFLKSKTFDHHHRSVVKAALLHSFSSACSTRPVRLELLNINPLITRGQRSLLQSSSSALHCYFNVINPSRHFSSVAPPTQFSQSAPASRFYKPVDPPFPF
jgi:hypothetical protein